eukprot:CAMPEP_0181327236 /NCGR_PEP_ID=MMETSP1101-20121128/21978_1 /TAXON_ID=46948 /ORGANISM="Rhodomonas abbreviata, Strain Caron Lab Isolate" /LENGTH=224 /DNA_ID=CAMNT_0023435851 /DNA_START=133 /DNA_END=803 /DNA_ORIENTATION=+
MCALNPDNVPLPCGESNPTKGTCDEDFGLETYSKIKSALVHFKKRGKRTEAVVSRAEKYLMIGIGWIGFKSADELDTWCIEQMNKARDLIKTIIDNSFDPKQSPRTKIESILRYVRPPPPPMRDMKKMAAKSPALCAPPPPPPPANSSRSLRSTEEYDDETWIRMLDDQTKESLCEEDSSATISCASTVDTRNTTPDSFFAPSNAAGTTPTLLSTVQNLFLPSP